MVHSNFKIQKGRFYLNRYWNLDTLERFPQRKLVTKFNNLSLLDKCPFVAMVAKDTDGDHEYIAHMYDIKENEDLLAVFGNNFDRAALYDMNDKFIKSCGKRSWR